MINRVVVKPKICSLYHLPQIFLCSDPQCTSTSTICGKCAKFNHPHLNQVSTIEEFITRIETTVDKARMKCQEDDYNLNISSLVKNKKQQIESIQLDLMELVIKKLSEEKRRLFQVLESIERTYNEKGHIMKKAQQTRKELVQYLSPFARSKQLAQLKLQTSSGWAIARLKENLAELTKLSGIFGKKEMMNLEQTVTRQINLSIDMQLFKTLKECFKQKPKSQPLYFVASPPPRRYSFKSRQSTETNTTRPNSSAELNTRSIERSRPIQARSNIIL